MSTKVGSMNGTNSLAFSRNESLVIDENERRAVADANTDTILEQITGQIKEERRTSLTAMARCYLHEATVAVNEEVSELRLPHATGPRAPWPFLRWRSRSTHRRRASPRSNAGHCTRAR